MPYRSVSPPTVTHSWVHTCTLERKHIAVWVGHSIVCKSGCACGCWVRHGWECEWGCHEKQWCVAIQNSQLKAVIPLCSSSTCTPTGPWPAQPAPRQQGGPEMSCASSLMSTTTCSWLTNADSVHAVYRLCVFTVNDRVYWTTGPLKSLDYVDVVFFYIICITTCAVCIIQQLTPICCLCLYSPLYIPKWTSYFAHV